MIQKINKLKQTNDELEKLQSDFEAQLEDFANQFLTKGETIIDSLNNSEETGDYIKYLNSLVIVPWDIKENQILSNNEMSRIQSTVHYIKCNPTSKYFVGTKAITEIHFEDSLEVTTNYNLIEITDKHVVFDIVFESARVRERNKNVVGNMYRFVYSRYKKEITCSKRTT